MINNITIIIANILPTFRLERFPCLVNIMLFSYLKYFLCLHCKNFFGFISLIWKIDSSAPFCADHRTKRGPTNTEERIRMPSFNQHDRWREKIIAMEVRSNSQCKTISTDYVRCCYFLILSGPLKYQWILKCETRVSWKTLRELCWTFFLQRKYGKLSYRSDECGTLLSTNFLEGQKKWIRREFSLINNKKRLKSNKAFKFCK